MSVFHIIATCIIVIIIVLVGIYLKRNTDLRNLLLLLLFRYLTKFIIVTGVFIGLISLFQNLKTLYNSFTVYIVLVVILLLLFQITNKIPSSANIKQVSITIRNYLVFIISTSGFLYWHISNAQPQTDHFEAWIISLDVILAHVVITLPILQWLYYTTLKILRVSESLLLLEFLGLFHRLEDSRYTIYSIFHDIVNPSISISIALGFAWLLLVKTVDLQNALFGRYSQFLGWEVATNYRFSILFEQLRILFDNPVLATIFGFAAFTISLTLSFSSLISSIKNIKNELRKTADDS